MAARLVGQEVHGRDLSETWMFVPQRDQVRCSVCEFPQLADGWVPEPTRFASIAEEIAAKRVVLTFDGWTLLSNEGHEIAMDSGLKASDFLAVTNGVWTFNYLTAVVVEPQRRAERDTGFCGRCNRLLRRELVDFGDSRERIIVSPEPSTDLFKLSGMFGRRDLWRPVVMVSMPVFHGIRSRCKISAGWRAVVED